MFLGFSYSELSILIFPILGGCIFVFTLLWLSNSSSGDELADLADRMEFKSGKKFLGRVNSIEGEYQNLPVVVTAISVGTSKYGSLTSNGYRITVKEPQQIYCLIHIKDFFGLSPFFIPQVKGENISINKGIDEYFKVIVLDAGNALEVIKTRLNQSEARTLLMMLKDNGYYFVNFTKDGIVAQCYSGDRSWYNAENITDCLESLYRLRTILRS